MLKLLAEKPRHGYEIIKELDERSNGFYVPSPGMVYPALNRLEELHHATVGVDGSRKLYSITDLGREHLTENMAPANALLEQFGRVGERMARVRAMLDEESGEQGSRVTRHGGRTELKRALHELQSALECKWSAPADEQQRVAAILQHAAAQIGGPETE